MEEMVLKDFREGFGFSNEELTLKRTLFGGYNRNEADEVIRQLNQNCLSMQQAFEEKNTTFAAGLAAARQEVQSLHKKLEELHNEIDQKDEQIFVCQSEIDELKQLKNTLESRLDEVKHIRNDETLLKENLCLQEQLEENRQDMETLRSEIHERDQVILQQRQTLQQISDKAQADLNLAYRMLDFRMEKFRTLIADFRDVSAEVDRFIALKLEEIACGNGR